MPTPIHSPARAALLHCTLGDPVCGNSSSGSSDNNDYVRLITVLLRENNDSQQQPMTMMRSARFRQGSQHAPTRVERCFCVGKIREILEVYSPDLLDRTIQKNSCTESSHFCMGGTSIIVISARDRGSGYYTFCKHGTARHGAAAGGRRTALLESNRKRYLRH